MPLQMGWKEAAIEVLKNQPEGMLYTEITQEIIDRGLRTKLGATPASSLGTTLSDSIRWDIENTPFERVGPGRYRLKTFSQGHPQAPSPPSAATLEAEQIQEKKETTGLINAFGMFWSRDKVQWGSSITKLSSGNRT